MLTRKEIAQARRLKKLRIAKGLKQSWVADEMKISGTVLNMLESGARRWNSERLASFLKIVGE